MRARIIGLASAEGTPPPPGARNASLAGASRAFLDAGIAADLEAAGGTIESIVIPELAPGGRSDDPIRTLGELNGLIADAVYGALAVEAAPLLVGGTCCHLIGMLAGLQRHFGIEERIGLLWLDAHGDFNTPRTSRSQMIGGMPVATAAGLCWPDWRERAGMPAPLPTNRIVMVDVRNLDPDEETLIAATDVEIARFGPEFDPTPVTEAIERLAGRIDHLYVHVDADILDASLQPNHTTPEPGGPGLEPVLTALEAAFATGKVRAFGVVSVNPDGPGGAISLASGRRLITGGMEYWVRYQGIAV